MFIYTHTQSIQSLSMLIRHSVSIIKTIHLSLALPFLDGTILTTRRTECIYLNGLFLASRIYSFSMQKIMLDILPYHLEFKFSVVCINDISSILNENRYLYIRIRNTFFVCRLVRVRFHALLQKGSACQQYFHK